MARSGGLATSAAHTTASRASLKTTPRRATCTTSSSGSGDSKTETRSSSSGSSSSGLGDSTAISSGSGDTKGTIHSLMEGRRASLSRPPFVVQGTGRVSLGGPQQKSLPTAGSSVGSATQRANSARVRRTPETSANASSSSGSSLQAPSSDLGSRASTMNGSSSATKASRRMSVPSFQVASPPSSLAARTPRTADLSARSTPCSSSKLVKPAAGSITYRQNPRSASKTSTCNGSGNRSASVVGPKAGSVPPRGLAKAVRTASTVSSMAQSTKRLSGGSQEGEGSPPGTKAELQQGGKKTSIPQYSWTKQVVSSQQTGGKALTRSRKSTMTRPASAAVLGNSNANGCCRSTYPANGWLTERTAAAAAAAAKAREGPNMRTTLATLPNSARSHFQLQDQQRAYQMQHIQAAAPQQSNSHTHHPHHPTPPPQQQSHQHQVQTQQQYQQLQNRWSASRGQMCAPNGIVNNSVTPIAVVPLASSLGASTMISHFHTPSPDARVQPFASPIMMSSQSAGGTVSHQVIQSLHHQHQHPPILQLSHRPGQHNENQGSGVMSAQTHRCVSASKIRPPGVPMHQYVVSPTPMCMPGVTSCVHPGQPVPRQGWVAQSTPTSSSHVVVPTTQAVNPPVAPKAPMQAVVTVTSRHAPAVSSTVPRALSSLPVRQMPHIPVPQTISPAIGLPQSARLDSARLSRLPGYTIGPVVGEGGFCKVRLGTHQLTSAKVAIKIIDKARLVDPADRKRVAREIKVLKRLTQGTIIQLLEVVESPTRVHVIMEYASGGSLLDYVRARKKLEESEARRFLVQIVKGLEYCHSRMVVHRDIKLENLLLDSEKNMKIIDFGLSAILTAGKKLRVHCGSPSYAAPEIVARKLYDGPPVDVWSLGVVLFAMISGYLPFYAGSSKEDLCQKIINGSYRAPDWISNESRNLLAGMLTTDPAQRLTLTQINQHSWVRGTKSPGTPLLPPPLLVEFIPGTSEQVRLDDDVLKELEGHGLDRESTRESLRRCEHNYATATYYLLALKKHYRKGKELRPNGLPSENDSSQRSPSVVPTPMSMSSANTSVSSVGKSANMDGGGGSNATSGTKSAGTGSFGKGSFCGKVRVSSEEGGVSKWVAGIPGVGTHMVSGSANGVVPSVGVTSVCGNEIVVLSRQMPMRMPLVGAQGTVV